MFITMFRTIILYSTVVIAMRLMGKRQIGELQPFELAIAIMISDLASFPMQDIGIPLIHGVIPIITLLVFHVILSVIQLKSEKARAIICGSPSILINNGKIDINQLKDQRYNLNDLLEELRLNGYFNVNDVKYAILETSGKLSIIPKSPKSPVTREDLHLPPAKFQLPVSLIMDGKVNYDNLVLINKDIIWLNQKLKENNITSPQDIFIAILDSTNKFFYQYKEGVKSEK